MMMQMKRMKMKILTYLEGLIRMKMNSERLALHFLSTSDMPSKLVKMCKLELQFPVSHVFQDTGLPSFADELAARIKGETPHKPEADRTCMVT